MSIKNLPDDLPVPPGMRFVESRDDRTTSRTRWDLVPSDAPNPLPEVNTPEQLAHVRALSKRLMANHGPDARNEAGHRDPTTSQQEERP
ncbi:MAG: hypothetical protein Q8R60_06740 [Mycobacteriales bacterium]|nr:hypothetical protein [Mycobacteriales bacterium]